MPQTQDITLDISTIIKEVENLHTVVTTDLTELYTPRAIFTLVHDIDPMDLAGGKATPTKTLPDDVETPPLLTHMTFQYSPLIYAPGALDSPPPLLSEGIITSVCLVSEGDLPGDCITAANDNLFGVYQYWVHQNPGTHQDGGIE